MMARNATVPLTGRIQKRKTNHLRIVIFGLQRAAGPYRRATSGLLHRNKTRTQLITLPVREHHRECRTLLFVSNGAALHSANLVNDITCPTGDRMYVLVQGTG